MADGEDSLTVDLQWQGDGDIKVTKRLTLRRGDYLIDVDYLVENNSDATLAGKPVRSNQARQQPPPSAESAGMGMQPFLGVAITQPDDRFTKFTFDDLAEEPFKAQLPGGWIAMIQHYFLSAWIPNAEQSHTFSARVTRSGFNIAGFTSPALVLDPGNSGKVGPVSMPDPKTSIASRKFLPTWISVLTMAGCGGLPSHCSGC